MSVGSPAIHHDIAIVAPPVTKYTGQHNSPNNDPYMPDKILQKHTDVLFLNTYVTPTNIAHIYKYINHQMPKPYNTPSIKQNAGKT